MENFTKLVPLNEARRTLIPSSNGQPVDCSTVWRWVNKGIAGPDGERIRLAVTYVGRRPHVSADSVSTFFEAVTNAKAETRRRKELACQRVSRQELKDAGLLS